MRVRHLLFTILFVTSLRASAQEEEVIDRVVATIGKDVITLSEVEQRLREARNPLAQFIVGEQDAQMSFQHVLDELIAEALLMREARKLEIEVTNEEVERSIRAMMAENGWDDEDLDTVLKMMGYDRKRFFALHREQILRHKVLQYKVYSRLRISDREVEDAFLKEYHGGKAESQVHLWHIVLRIPTEVTLEQLEGILTRAKEIRQKIIAGEITFEEAARKYSEDSASAQAGGDVGFFGQGQLLRSLEEVAFSLKDGEVSSVVQSPIGFHILRVTERRLAPLKDPEEARARVRYRLTEEAFHKEYKAYIQSLRAEARVKIVYSSSPRERNE